MDDDRWLYVELKRDGRPHAAALRLPFDRTRWPDYQHHVALAVAYAPHWRTGMPRNAKELTRLQDLEDRWIASLQGHGALVATETGDAQRTVHLYFRGGGDLEASLGQRATVTHDPAWAQVAHLSVFAVRAA
jgi:hypothetical protein